MFYDLSMFKVNSTSADNVEDVFSYFANPLLVAVLVYLYNTFFTALSIFGNIFIIFVSVK